MMMNKQQQEQEQEQQQQKGGGRRLEEEVHKWKTIGDGLFRVRFVFLNVMPHLIYFLHRRLITRKRSTRTRKRKRIWNSSCLRRAARLRLRRTRSIRSKRREFY